MAQNLSFLYLAVVAGIQPQRCGGLTHRDVVGSHGSRGFTAVEFRAHILQTDGETKADKHTQSVYLST